MCVAVVAVGLFSGSTRAGADAPTRQGWWSASAPATAVTAADVPPDGLLVQGGATGPSAVAALEFVLPAGSSPGKLTLRLAPDAGTTPGAILRVCRLTGPFAPAQGGSLSDAPTYDCAHPVTGPVETDHVTVDVSSLASGDGLSVALLPTAPTDRIVFAAPDANALEVHEATVLGGDATTALTGDAAPVSSAGSAAAAPSFADVPALPSVDAPSIPEATSGGPSATAPRARAVAAAASLPDPRGTSAPVLAATLAILGVTLTIVLWLCAGGLASA